MAPEKHQAPNSTPGNLQAPITAPAGQPASQPSAPTFSQPAKHRLNHSYIWLGTLRLVPYLAVALFAGMSEGLVELAQELNDRAGADAGAGSGAGSAAGASPEAFPWALPIDPAAIGLLVCALLLLVVAGITLACRAIAYRYIWYEYAGCEFTFCSGIFSKKRVHVPYTRIQSVNQKASLLQRLAGVCTVQIETAGGAENKAVELPYIERSAAEELRKELFARKRVAEGGAVSEVEGAAPAPSNLPAPSGVPVALTFDPDNILDTPAQLANQFRGAFGGQEISTGEVSYEFALTNKQLLLAALTSKSSFAIAVATLVGGIGSIISLFSLLSGICDSFLLNRMLAPDDVHSAFFAGATLVVIAFIIGSLLLCWVSTIAGTCITYGGFRARRRGKRVETEYGIISHNFSGIDIDRIQSVEISQSFFQRLLKCCTISLARVASATQETPHNSSQLSQANLVVHPFVRLDKVPEILAGLLPEWSEAPQATHAVPKRALRRAIVRKAILQGGGFWFAISTAVCLWAITLPGFFGLVSPEEMADYVTLYSYAKVAAGIIFVFCALLFVVNVIDGILWQRSSRFGYNRAFVAVENGGFSTTRSITPRTKVQLAEVRTNPLQRGKQLATIRAITAAGFGASTIKLIDVEASEAQTWFAWCHPNSQ